MPLTPVLDGFPLSMILNGLIEKQESDIQRSNTGRTNVSDHI